MKMTTNTAQYKQVPPKSINEVFSYLENGGTLIVPTYTRCTVITKKTLDKFRKAGAWLLKEEGNGYRMQTGRSSVYLFPGDLKYYVEATNGQ
jgi:hypothetical protein